MNKLKLWKEKHYSDNGFLYLKAHNSYIKGITGVDIRLTLLERIQILFCGGISVTLVGKL